MKKEYKIDPELAAIELVRLQKKFTESKNPLMVIEALTLAHRAGQVPPTWVLDFLPINLTLSWWREK